MPPAVAHLLPGQRVGGLTGSTGKVKVDEHRVGRLLAKEHVRQPEVTVDGLAIVQHHYRLDHGDQLLHAGGQVRALDARIAQHAERSPAQQLNVMLGGLQVLRQVRVEATIDRHGRSHAAPRQHLVGSAHFGRVQADATVQVVIELVHVLAAVVLGEAVNVAVAIGPARLCGAHRPPREGVRHPEHLEQPRQIHRVAVEQQVHRLCDHLVGTM
mmetsp:Transcript_6978/g.17641  ORF Transcript_6978/g.17641 Transcript_6978/m.17641 type:complete len:213 (-) Transcript_6978:1405-2043(-)